MSENSQSPNKLNHAPGLACPQCGFRIQVTVKTLLEGLPVYCSSCGLELTIDQEKSKAAIDALEKLQNSIEKVERIKAETKAIKHD